MKRRLGIALTAMTGLTHGAAIASLPEIPPPRHFYGPLTACTRGVAFEVRKGEAYSDYGGLHLPGVGLIVESWIYSGMDMSDIVRPLGTVELPDGVRLERIRLSSRNAPGSEIVYLHDTRARTSFPVLSIRSNRFDGTDGDLALLERVAFGEAAKKICEAIPEALRVTPERENPDAGWLDPEVHRGPLTICSKDMAFEVAAEESALLPWSLSWPRFRILAAGRRIDLSLEYRLHFPAPIGDLPVADTPGIHRVEIDSLPSSGPVADQAGGPRFTRLVAPNPGDRRTPETMPGLVFSFDRTISAEERTRIVRRLRWRRPGDDCFRAVD